MAAGEEWTLPAAARVGIGTSPYLALRCTRKDHQGNVVEKQISARAMNEELELFQRTTNAKDSEYCATGEVWIDPDTGIVWLTDIEFHKTTYAQVVETKIRIGGVVKTEQSLQIIHMQTVKLRIHRDGRLHYANQSAALSISAETLKSQIAVGLKSTIRADIKCDGRTILPRVALMEGEQILNQMNAFLVAKPKPIL